MRDQVKLFPYNIPSSPKFNGRDDSVRHTREGLEKEMEGGASEGVAEEIRKGLSVGSYK